MPEEITIRLSQIARKLNVGTTTLVTYLSEKGLHIDNKPNTKLTVEQSDLVHAKFSSEVTEKSTPVEGTPKKIPTPIASAITPSHDHKASTASTSETPAPPAEVRATPSPAKAPSSTEKITFENKAGLQGPTVLGTIDLVPDPPKRFQQVASSAQAIRALSVTGNLGNG